MMKKNKGGQPTKYRKEYCNEIIEFCKEGRSFEAFAGHIGVAVDTIYEWANKHSDFSDAKKIAQAASLNWWEEYGRKNLLSITETSGSGSSKSTTSTSINAAMWVYNMKCRFRKQWTEVQKIKQVIDEKNATNVIKIAYVPKSLRDSNGNNGND